MAVPILKQGSFLIASIQSALTDTDLVQLRDALVGQVGSYRSRGVIVDVTALDVLDSFASRTLRDLAHMVRLRGAEHRPLCPSRGNRLATGRGRRRSWDRHHRAG